METNLIQFLFQFLVGPARIAEKAGLASRWCRAISVPYVSNYRGRLPIAGLHKFSREEDK